ncbi:MAG: alpha/beta fold hydrolase, partial [Proteobacteria bacterium]|nr:alpha/beta fold hydrolase [Pseudomonadota bacterium]
FMDDVQRGTISMVDESTFAVGKNLATAPGAVVYRNELLELIQYTPTTETVHEVPILLVPPWINKYYILDLGPKKSLIRYLTGQGFTVFTVSWKNPGADLRGITLDDYMLKGVGEAVEAAREITGAKHVHLTGYCIGGTIVACYMAWMNRTPGSRKALPVQHWTTLATLVDFENPGDVDVFISEAGIASLEKRMAREGYLDGSDMAGTFRMLRANSLIWHYWVRNYLYGEKPRAMDVLYWNMDTTRMPEAMHAFYLREFYLENKLSRKDGVTLGGRKIDLGRISQPLYAVGTEQDHIAPWVETFKVCQLVKSPVRYALSTSGHILGIINPPVDPPKRQYWAGEASGADAPEAWKSGLEEVPGTWWDDWVAWLRPQCGERVAPPGLGSAHHPRLADAPGTYVLER